MYCLTGMQPKAAECASDAEGVAVPIEDVSWDQRAGYLQEQLAAHPDLKLSSALGKMSPVHLSLQGPHLDALCRVLHQPALPASLTA